MMTDLKVRQSEMKWSVGQNEMVCWVDKTQKSTPGRDECNGHSCQDELVRAKTVCWAELER